MESKQAFPGTVQNGCRSLFEPVLMMPLEPLIEVGTGTALAHWERKSSRAFHFATYSTLEPLPLRDLSLSR